MKKSIKENIDHFQLQLLEDMRKDCGEKLDLYPVYTMLLDIIDHTSIEEIIYVLHGLSIDLHEERKFFHHFNMLQPSYD